MRFFRRSAASRSVPGHHGRLRKVTARTTAGPDVVSRRLPRAESERWGRLHLRYDLAQPDAHRRFPDEGPGWRGWGVVLIVMVALLALAGAPL
jgi:hypothetical protein